MGDKKSMNTEGTLDFQIGFERRISQIYEAIAAQFLSEGGRAEEVEMWKKLARDEVGHAELLAIEKTLLQTGIHLKKPVEMDEKTRERAERLLALCEEKIEEGLSREKAVQILKLLERYDRLFISLLSATDSKLLSQFLSLSSRYKAHERRVREGLRICEKRLKEGEARLGKAEAASV